MRVIDADELLAEDFTDSFVDPYDQAIFEAIIEQAPTIEAEPVKHGRWVADDKFDNGKSSIFHCSECYYSKATSVLYTSEKLSADEPYCKKCGAKMDLEG